MSGRIFFLQLLDKAVHQHRSGFLLEIAEFAGQLARKGERLAINDGELLPKLLVFALDLLRPGCFRVCLRVTSLGMSSIGTIWPSSTGKISGKATAPTCM